MLGKVPKRSALAALVVLALAAVLGLATIAYHPTPIKAAGPTPTPFVLNEATVTPTPVPTVSGIIERKTDVQGIRYSGNLLSGSQSNVAFQVGGRVQDIKVKEGDKIKAGQVLIVLDASVTEIQVQQAQAAYNLAKATYDKVKQGPTADDIALAKSQVDRAKASVDQTQAAYDRAGGLSNPYIAMTAESAALQQATSAYQGAMAQFNSIVNHPTDAELRQAQAQVDQAQAALNLAKQNLVYGTLTAPIDGTAVNIVPKVGEVVGPGTPVVLLADLAHMQVQVNIDETTLATLQVGQRATLTLDALAGKTLTGEISKIAWVGTSAAGIVSVPITIDIDPTDARIYPGLSVMVSFQTAP